MTEFFYGIGELFEASFKIIEKLGDGPNVLFIVICFAALILWVRRINIYNKEAEKNGTLK
ncbi:MAG: hypothetical protein J0M08_00150 [Bacteroidetes bacterium]|nr:hypothetical protein [Bacteroidota bacterium]